MKLYDPTQLGLQVAKPMGDELQVFCPYHFDSNPSAEYNIVKGLFYCFGCHTSKTAKQLAADLGGSLVPIRVIPDEYRSRPGDDLGWVSLMKTKRAEYSNRYLLNRDVLPWQIDRWDIRENEEGILFPMRDRNGDIRGMQIRHYERKPKYKFYGERTPVWPMEILSEARRREPRKIFLTEGIFGALRLQNISAWGMAIMGSGSIKRVAEIFQSLSFLEPYAVMDNDWAGTVAAGKFVLHGIPAVLIPKNWPEAPDEFDTVHLYRLIERLDVLSTMDVMDVIEYSSNPSKMQMILEKYWRKM